VPGLSPFFLLAASSCCRSRTDPTPSGRGRNKHGQGGETLERHRQKWRGGGAETHRGTGKETMGLNVDRWYIIVKARSYCTPTSPAPSLARGLVHRKYLYFIGRTPPLPRNPIICPTTNTNIATAGQGRGHSFRSSTYPTVVLKPAPESNPRHLCSPSAARSSS